MVLFEACKSIMDVFRLFPDEESCLIYLEGIRWSDGIVSPFDERSEVYVCANHRFKCKNTGKYFNAKTKTIFENTKVPLRSWFIGIYLFLSDKKGISSYQLANVICVTQTTAWRMLMKMRQSMELSFFSDDMEGIISVDETFVGGKNKNRHKDKKVEKSQGRSFKDKTPVLGLLEGQIYMNVERPHKVIPGRIVKEKVIVKQSRLNCWVVPNTKKKMLQPIIKQTVGEGSVLISDEWYAYKGLEKYYEHQVVDHKRGQYVNGNFTTNALEGAWSHFKRSIIGVYHSVSRKYLQHYANEFAFRYNMREEDYNEVFGVFLQSAQSQQPFFKSYRIKC